MWCASRFKGSRIIPARAGFTVIHRVFHRFGRDHPRSRGVYELAACWAQPILGSSPLARGLRMLLFTVGGARGIIPARAGFTAPPRIVLLPSQDHPRSRGVYRLTSGTTIVRKGSSPLARGLLVRVMNSEWCLRIIPARAGFTRSVFNVEHCYRDHPRSRGVY